MDIQHKHDDPEGSFFIEKDGEIKAEITYSKTSDNEMIIDHTKVSKALRGQSIGKILVEKAVNYARKNELKVIPHCSYAKSVIEKDDSLRDVLK